ncbi:hypothetical protein [Pontibacter russatus]|uniref:hypothetical protein n=1 Tax=Pontibacter russatus TaxID=2694929 RepID=UPI001379A518|nr:hypothetical protein [Pontibacter russatus]
MSLTESPFMELAYEAATSTLSVGWSDDLSVESPLFFETIVSLFATIHEKRVTNLLVSSGIPSGGVLTEEVINYFIRQIPDTPLKHIAILESPDYLWDDNLYKVITLLVSTFQLPISVKLAASRAVGKEWIASLCCQCAEDKAV